MVSKTGHSTDSGRSIYRVGRTFVWWEEELGSTIKRGIKSDKCIKYMEREGDGSSREGFRQEEAGEVKEMVSEEVEKEISRRKGVCRKLKIA